MLFLETVLLFLDLNIPYIIITSLTAEQYFMKLSNQRISYNVGWQGKKIIGPAGIEPGPSDVGIRNATVTPGCLILNYIDLHALYVLPISGKTAWRIQVDSR